MTPSTILGVGALVAAVGGCGRTPLDLDAEGPGQPGVRVHEGGTPDVTLRMDSAAPADAKPAVDATDVADAADPSCPNEPATNVPEMIYAADVDSLVATSSGLVLETHVGAGRGPSYTDVDWLASSASVAVPLGERRNHSAVTVFASGTWAWVAEYYDDAVRVFDLDSVSLAGRVPGIAAYLSPAFALPDGLLLASGADDTRIDYLPAPEGPIELAARLVDSGLTVGIASDGQEIFVARATTSVPSHTTIHRARFDGGEAKLIADLGAGDCCGGGLALGGGFVYAEVVTDTAYELRAVRISDGAVTTARSLQGDCCGVEAIEADDDFVYWTERGDAPGVFRRRHCGGARVRLATFEGLGWNSVALGSTDRALYWNDNGIQKLAK